MKKSYTILMPVFLSIGLWAHTGIVFGQAAITPACGINQVERANAEYEIANFDAVFELLLDQCSLESTESAVVSIDAYQLLALSSFEIGDYNQVELWTSKILELDPEYEANRDVAPIYYINLVDALRPKKWHQTWFWRGVMAGGVVGLTSMAIRGGQGGNQIEDPVSSPLPLPILPSNN